MFEIEKGVAPPKKRGRVTYPFSEMAVGDSFVVKGDEQARKRAGCAAVLHGKRKGKKFARRTKNEIMRIWRTE